METLAVFHILKNGGTTLIDRYRTNSTFAYQRVSNELVFNFKQPNQHKVLIENCKDQNVRLIIGHGVSFDLDKHLQNSVKYATILRDPIKRIMSAYNYFKLEMINVHSCITDIDFTTWIINCSRLHPTPVYAQYQKFSNEQCLRIDYGRKISIEYEQELYDRAIENIKRIDHMFFMEDNYLKQFDKVAKQYDLKPNLGIIYEHNTKFNLSLHGIDYVTYEELTDTEKQFVEETTAKDIEFYNYCKEKFA